LGVNYIRASRFSLGDLGRAPMVSFKLRRQAKSSMANNPGAKKAIRKIAKRTEVNTARRSRVRTFLRRFDEALASGDAGAAATAFTLAQSELMRAVGKGVVHPNTGSRKVSRLHRQLRKLTVA
jgi:small subunit ribosomal protein S20